VVASALRRTDASAGFPFTAISLRGVRHVIRRFSPALLRSASAPGDGIGAEIEGADLGRPLTEELRAELNRALLEWKVLFFRDQDITSAQQRAFARNWGERETNPLLPAGDSAEVTRLWADMAAAYDNLPADVRERITGLRAVHDFVPGFVRFSDRECLARRQPEFPPVEHPVVRTHPETGRPTRCGSPSA
jgi:taurine dioxygenase